MKVLIVSDTHKHNYNFYEVLEMVGPVDMVIHCGDTEGSEYEYEAIVDCPIHVVAGNNDFFSRLPSELELMIGKYKVWITHGHQYYVSMGNQILKDEARTRGIDIVFYGHTHRPVIDIGPDVTVVNPGSLSYPRQEGRKPSYVLMDIDREGEAHFTLRYVE
ncbi:MAG: metallophosphoesterase [Lachnospiraceae bacterium]|nr:metallophosphoesterase [Lachnospiraceae bacterium]